MVEYLNETTLFEGIYLRRIREGGTPYWIPDPKHYAKPGYYLPFELPLFYNPMMELNRDLSVIALATYLNITDSDPEDITYIELLAGTGIRGFRVLNEVGAINVIMNDLNPQCVRFMHFNARFFPPEIQSHATILNYEANHLLNSIRLWRKKVDAIDIDPFGTPTPFIDSAIRTLRKKRGLLLLTATDTSALIGKFPQSARRKYGVYTFATPFGGEVAVRTLIYYTLNVATKYGLALRPLFGFFFMHFIKIAFITIPGRKVADRFLWEETGWIEVQEKGTRILKTLQGKIENKVIGPLWLGPIYDKEFIGEALKILSKLPLSDKTRKKLELWFQAEIETAFIPFYYNVELIASKLRKTTPKIKEVINELQRLGYIAERTHFHPKAIKTNAPPKVLEEVIKKL